MKKLKFVLAFASVLLLANSAFALQCDVGQALHGPDACWTKVTLSSIETNLVSQGHALVFEIDENTAKQGAYQVIRSTASTDGHRIAGFAQGSIASGQSALVLVRGFGFVRTVGGVVSGDALNVAASGNVGVVSHSSTTLAGSASTEVVAVSLVTSSTNGTNARHAYIKVL